MKAQVLEFMHHQLIPEQLSSPIIAVAVDVLVIPVTHPYVQKTTGADAEALTLADGLAGQLLVVNLKTDGGGAGTITPATATGWATAVLDEAGDNFTFFYVDDTVGWIVLGAVGVAAAPVISV